MRFGKRQHALASLPDGRRSPERLAALLQILRCPLSGRPLKQIGTALRAGRHEWPLLDGVPALFPGIEPTVHSAEHISNALPPRAKELIAHADGLVLNVSAGGTEMPPPHVVEAEFGLFRNTDVIADVHALPFVDGAFSCVLAINAFEHYHDPVAATREIWRVLRPGGQVLIQTAFLQPLHEGPHHYYNCTEFGLRKWFREFEELELTVTDNFNPLYVFAWLSDALQSGLLREQKPELAEALAGSTLRDLAAFWREPARHPELRELFMRVPEGVQRQMAAGFQFAGRKPA